MTGDDDAPHLPQQALIEAYGKGGFRFAGMSHRGSLICLPSGIWGWPVVKSSQIDEAALARVFAAGGDLDTFLLGTGRDPWIMPETIRATFRRLGIALEVATTGAAVRTYNILVAERRRVGAGLIAVD